MVAQNKTAPVRRNNFSGHDLFVVGLPVEKRIAEHQDWSKASLPPASDQVEIRPVDLAPRRAHGIFRRPSAATRTCRP
jgi:hypothetical protein